MERVKIALLKTIYRMECKAVIVLDIRKNMDALNGDEANFYANQQNPHTCKISCYLYSKYVVNLHFMF